VSIRTRYHPQTRMLHSRAMPTALRVAGREAWARAATAYDGNQHNGETEMRERSLSNA
jgi:hypothetical protein